MSVSPTRRSSKLSFLSRTMSVADQALSQRSEWGSILQACALDGSEDVLLMPRRDGLAASFPWYHVDLQACALDGSSHESDAIC